MTTRPLGLATIWRRHLRRFGTGLLLATITALMTILVVAAPRVEDAAYDHAIGDQLRSAPYGLRDIQLSFSAEGSVRYFFEAPLDILGGVPVSPQESVDRATRALLGPVSRLVRSATFSAQTKPNTVILLDADGRPRPGQEAKEAMVRVQSDFAGHVHWDAGAMPGPATMHARVPYRFRERTVQRPVDVIPVAIESSVARDWRLAVGDRIRLESGTSAAAYDTAQPIIVEIAGTFTPLDRRDTFWDAEARMMRAAVIPMSGPGGGFAPQAVLVTAPANYGPLGASMFPRPRDLADFVAPPGATDASAGMVHEWRYVLDDRAMTRTSAADLAAAVSRINLARAEWGTTVPHVATGLLDLLRAYDRAVAVTSALLLFVLVALVAAATLAMSRLGVALVEERQASLLLLRARGASLAQLIRLTLADVLVWTIPAAALGAAAAILGVRGSTRTETVVLALVPVAALALVAVTATVSLARLRTGRSDVAPRAARARRLGVEILVLAATYFVVGSLRSRDQQIRTGTSDWVAALAPALLALAAAVVLLRLFPLVIRSAAAVAASGRSLFAFVALHRSAREPRASRLPVVVLVVAAMATSLLATLGSSIERARLDGVYRSVGADVRLDAVRIDPPDVVALRGRAGVQGAVAAYTDSTQLVGPTNLGNENVAIVAADPGAYADALAGTPLAFDPTPLAGDAIEGAIPALASSGLRLPGSEFQVLVDGLFLPIHVVGLDPALARGTAGRPAVPVLLMPLDRVIAMKKSTQPNTVFIAADDDAARSLVTGAPPTGLTQRVLGRADLQQHIAGLALPRVVRSAILIGLALGGLFAVVAALQLLAATRRPRADTMIRLRTMGLARGGEWRLGVIELLPVALAAIGTGVGVGIVVPRVLSGILDLSPYSGGPAYPPVRASVVWTAAIVAGLLALVVLALVVDGLRARRTGLADHLRAGDQR